MFAAGSSINGAVPTWTGTTGNAMSSGGIPLGVGPNYIPILNGLSHLPAKIGAAAAYVSFTSSGAIFLAYNVTTVTKTGIGQYDVTFTTGPGATTYVAIATQSSNGPTLTAFIVNKTATICTVGVFNTLTQAYADGAADVAFIW